MPPEVGPERRVLLAIDVQQLERKQAGRLDRRLVEEEQRRERRRLPRRKQVLGRTGRQRYAPRSRSGLGPDRSA